MGDVDRSDHESYPDWHGPIKRRKCTDVICLCIFAVIIISWCITGFLAISYGNVGRFFASTDSEDRKCGYHFEVLDKPYAFFLNVDKCLPPSCKGAERVCVSKCPSSDFIFGRNMPLNELKSKMICKTDVDIKNADINQLNAYVTEKKCAEWYPSTKLVLGYCIPNENKRPAIQAYISSINFNFAVDHIKSLTYYTEIKDDIITSRYLVLGVIVGSAAMCIVYILILRWFATQFIFASLIAICGVLCYAVYKSYLFYKAEEKGGSGVILLCASCLILIFYVLFIIVFMKKIYLACQLIEETCRAVTQILSSLIVPIFPWIIQLAILIYTVYIAICLQSAKVAEYQVDMKDDNCLCPPALNYTDKSACTPTTFNASCKSNGEPCPESSCLLVNQKTFSLMNYLHANNIIGSFWLFFFTAAVGEFTIAGTFVIWYWTYRKSDIPFFTVSLSFWRTIRYHLGTVAFGSFFITICNMIRFFLYTKKVQSSGSVMQVILSVLLSCIEFIERIVRLISRNAYVVCAIYGKCFISSAREAISLITRNVVNVYVIHKITYWLFLVAKILVVSLSVFITWWYCSSSKVTVHYVWIPIILVAIGSYLIATLLFMVPSVAVETILMCFLEDCEHNDGTTMRPYFMNERLKSIFHKF